MNAGLDTIVSTLRRKYLLVARILKWLSLAKATAIVLCMREGSAVSFRCAPRDSCICWYMGMAHGKVGVFGLDT
jgi:hypothetical protein